MNAINLLRQDHAEINTLLAELTKATGDRRGILVGDLETKLINHDAIWNLYLAPELVAAGESGLAQYDAKVHDAIFDLIYELSESNLNTIAGVVWSDRVQKLGAVISQHITDEETHLFPRVEKLLSGKLDDIGAAMMRARKEAR